jgi:DNA-directed RNA polymerase specialized sigma subunit
MDEPLVINLLKFLDESNADDTTRAIMLQRFVLNETQHDTAKKLGIHVKFIQQLEKKYLQHFREYWEAKNNG